MLGEPPDSVPDDLTAEEYLELGIWYQESKKLEQARDALQRAIKLDAEGNAGIRARRLLAEAIPMKVNCPDVINRFHNIAMTAFSSPGRAEKQYRAMIEEHPDFEWPYRSLAESTCRRVGDLETAKCLLEDALKINPNYVAALVTMAETLLADMQYEEAGRYLDRVRTIAADNADAINLRRTLEILVASER